MPQHLPTSPNFHLNFNNRAFEQLSFTYSSVQTTPFSNNYIVAVSSAALEYIGLTKNSYLHDSFVKVFSGETLPEGAEYMAQVYAGHQFGHFLPQLGDGRSISLGEIINKENKHIDIQLKGSGKTPYSRMGDGRAVLRSCIREYLASESMFALDIPTTRALCITATSDYVYREKPEQGAVMTRLTESNIRFGHYEYFFHHNKMKELDELAQYCLTYLFPEAKNSRSPHLAMFQEITKRTATLIAKWQAVGFAHGVINTDNMSILGLTIDYGPFGFLDNYEPKYICNHSDHTGRYAFEEQPSIGLWNLNALAHTFTRWLTTEQLKETLATYQNHLVTHYHLLMSQKLGLADWQKNDSNLLAQFLDLLENKVDYHQAFRLLNQLFVDDINNEKCNDFIQLFEDTEAINQWLMQYRQRISKQTLNDEQRHNQQNSHNPKYILRNYLAEMAIRSANAGDYSEIAQLLNILNKPYDEQPEYDVYANAAPQWGKELVISCSS